MRGRSAEAPWKTLASVPEFADLTPANHVEAEPPATNETAHPQTRPDSRTLGMRGLVEELFNAFDSSLQRTKLITAALTGLGIGVALVIGHVSTRLWPDWTWAGSLAAGFVLLVLFSICSSIITQMTALEMSPLSGRQVQRGPRGAVRPCLALDVHSRFNRRLSRRPDPRVALPGWFTPEAPEVAGPGLETVLNIVTALRLLLEVICWPILSMALLLMGPILIVEEHSIWRGCAMGRHVATTHWPHLSVSGDCLRTGGRDDAAGDDADLSRFGPDVWPTIAGGNGAVLSFAGRCPDPNAVVSSGAMCSSTSTCVEFFYSPRDRN